jgi:hypothetical protein
MSRERVTVDSHKKLASHSHGESKKNHEKPLSDQDIQSITAILTGYLLNVSQIIMPP